MGTGDESGRRPKGDLDRLTSPPLPSRRVPVGDSQEEHQSFNALVGEAIRKARQEKGWTQAFLAEQARLSPNYVARLERGELGPSLFVANRLCDALAIALDTLVGLPGGAATRKTAKRRAVG